MSTRSIVPSFILLALACSILPVSPAEAQDPDLDARVQAFLDRQARQWRDQNVPVVDGRALHDLIVEHGYTRAVEVGTSTGHSAVWIAWALSKTGGKLITIEIDEGRYRQALANFEAAGVSDFIDARLADAHQLVPELEGPFDFVFVDADKEGYIRYLHGLLPKLEPGGCFTAHNVSPPTNRGRTGGRRGGLSGTEAFVAELLTTPGLDTEFFRTGGGLSISFKREP